jgi:hypothetical protein
LISQSRGLGDVYKRQQEVHLRNKYAAVKKAYEHYQLMIKLAESGEI